MGVAWMWNTAYLKMLKVHSVFTGTRNTTTCVPVNNKGSRNKYEITYLILACSVD